MSKNKTTTRRAAKTKPLEFEAPAVVAELPAVVESVAARPVLDAKIHRTAIVKMMRSLTYKHDNRTVFTDFVEAAALSIANSVDVHQREAREKRYLEVMRRYKPEEVALFPKMLGELVLAMEAEPHDALGMIYGELEISNKDAGQFFTPYELCRLMARMLVDDEMKAKVAANGYITTQEPACGAGATLIALAQEMKDAGINYQQCLHATAIDIDLRCVHMCFIQCSLLHIPAVIVHGNTLSLQEWSHWLTPAHIMGGWWYRLKRRRQEPPVVETPEENAA